MAKIQTVNQLISVFKDIATRHYQINGFGIGDDWENGASEAKMHPVLWINPVTASMPESESTGYKTFEIDFEVRVFDLVSKGESNENDVLSDCIDILKDIILEFKGHPYYVNSQLNIIDDISFEAFTEEFDEDVSGWVCELSLMTPILNSFCGIPAADITGFEFPGIDCPDVNVLCPVFVEDVTGVYPIVVTTVGTTKEVSIAGGGLPDTFVVSGVYDTGTLTLTRNDAVDVVVTGFASGGDNDYTTAATLTGNIITFDRTDTVGAYSVDLTSAINSAPDKFVSSGAFDDASKLLTLTLNDATDFDVDFSTLTTADKFVSSGAYDAINNKIVLTLNDATTVDIDTSAIGSGGGSITNVTSAEKAALTPTAGEFVYDTDLNALQRYNGSVWITQAGVGVLGLSSNIGEYTYYSNYADVIAAANSGDAIEQFGDIEDSSGVIVNINKPLTINLNGFTYTNASTGVSDGVQISTTGKVKILNGTIKRINGAYGLTQNRAIVLTAGGDLEMTGTDVINTTGMSLYSSGTNSTILNGRFTTTSQTINQTSVSSSASLVGTIFESSAYNKFQGVLYNIKATTTASNTLIGQTSEARFCEFRQTSASGYDALLMNSGAKAFYCECFNVSSNYPALRIGGIDTEIRYCLGHSTLDNGIETGSNTPKGVYNCTGINDSGADKYGGLFGSLEDGVYNSSFTGLGGYGAVRNTGVDGLFVKCNFINKNAAISNASFYDTSAGTVRVYDCYSEQADSGKPNLRFTSTSKVVYLAGNKLKGGTGISIAHASGNSQTTAEDSTGNIILD